ncbi:MAG: hypothetical protein L3J28_10030 [Candidatus Polarisedimenticolaceae bacterium]|nr:hypothetical protein [Candidatus Polarisedimenticolaceae bacterium]
MIRRYSAYYAGWCLAFGEHESDYDEQRDINWLFGDNKVGFALSSELRRLLYRELFCVGDHSPRVMMKSGLFQVGRFSYKLRNEQDLLGVSKFSKLFKQSEDIYMFQTSHFCYPTGRRITTFSIKKPPFIIHKEMPPLYLNLGE